MFDTFRLHRRIRALLPELEQLRSSLGSLERNFPEPLDRIVGFFNLTSPWHDRLDELKIRLGLKPSSEIGKRLDELFRHFENAGRSIYGINRTKPGEFVTSDKVFLGDVYGIWTFSAREFLGWKNRPRKQDWAYNSEEPVNAYDIISRCQVIPFIKSHTEPIIRLINELEEMVCVFPPICSANRRFLFDNFIQSCKLFIKYKYVWRKICLQSKK